MTLLKGTCSAELPFSIARCWTAVADVERAPEWQRTLVSLAVVERDSSGRPVVCDTVNDAKLFRVSARIRVTYSEPHRLGLSLISSENLDAMEGGWELEELGPDRTRASYTLAVDPGPVGLLARPLERAIRPFVMGQQADELAAALRAGRI